jgi:hypothetical protein
LLLINGVERKLVERNETNSRWVLTRLGRRVARRANRFKQLTIKQPTWEPSNPNQSRFLPNGFCWQCVSLGAIMKLTPYFADNIQEINMNGYTFDNHHAITLGYILNQFPKLKTLRVASTLVAANTFDSFLQRIKNNNTIEVLDIGNNRMSMVGVDHLNDMMKNGTLRRINLTLSFLDDVQAHHLIDGVCEAGDNINSVRLNASFNLSVATVQYALEKFRSGDYKGLEISFSCDHSNMLTPSYDTQVAPYCECNANRIKDLIDLGNEDIHPRHIADFLHCQSWDHTPIYDAIREDINDMKNFVTRANYVVDGYCKRSTKNSFKSWKEVNSMS